MAFCGRGNQVPERPYGPEKTVPPPPRGIGVPRILEGGSAFLRFNSWTPVPGRPVAGWLLAAAVLRNSGILALCRTSKKFSPEWRPLRVDAWHLPKSSGPVRVARLRYGSKPARHHCRIRPRRYGAPGSVHLPKVRRRDEVTAPAPGNLKISHWLTLAQAPKG